jgi:hypothetical protein
MWALPHCDHAVSPSQGTNFSCLATQPLNVLKCRQTPESARRWLPVQSWWAQAQDRVAPAWACCGMLASCTLLRKACLRSL